MGRVVRNALVFAGVVALIWILLALAWRIARWLLIVSTCAIVFTIAGLVLLVRVVAHRFTVLVSLMRSRRTRLSGASRN